MLSYPCMDRHTLVNSYREHHPMKTALDIMTVLSCFAMVVSGLAMSFYFIDRGIYTYWQLQWRVLWPEVMFRYRDHTKKQMDGLDTGIIFFFGAPLY